MYRYIVTESKTPEIEGAIYDSFGVAVYYDACDKGEEIADIPDVFLCRSKAEQFVHQCNQSRLSPVYLLKEIERAIS